MLKQHRFLIPCIVLVMIFIAVCSGWWFSLPRGDELPASIRIVPSAQEESGVSIDTSFSLTSDFSINEADIRSMLELDPAMNYSLSGGGKEWIITPTMPLRENAVYTFRVKNASGSPVQSYAFQTRSDLLISESYPANQAAYVDINTGIEFRFNRPGVDLSKGFEILPPISGRFETQEYACRFIPDEPLEHNSIYRITLKDLKSPDGAVLMEPYTVSFETAEEDGAESWDDLSVGNFTASFIPGDEMSVTLQGGERQGAAVYTMTLHKYPGINAYANVLRERDAFYRDQYGVKADYRASTDVLDQVMNVEGTLMNVDGVLTAPLPESLSEGYYLFTLSGESGGKEQFVQQMIQVVNLSLYAQSVEGETLVWLGDPVTGTPASGAVVELELEKGEELSAVADENGLAVLETGENRWAYINVVREGTPVWFSDIQISLPEKELPLSRSYYTAMYTDREIYLPGDPIHFWGIVKPRTNSAYPETVWVGLSTFWPKSGNLCALEVPVVDGKFEGVLHPDTMQADTYAITVSDGGQGIYQERYLEISEYTKPAYQITLETDKEFYYYGETVTFSVSANYYDGTPAAGARMTAQCYEARLEDYSFILDENGKATFQAVLDPTVYNGGENRVAGWEPQYTSWSVSSADEQPVNLNQWDSFKTLPSKIAAELIYHSDGSLSVSAAVLDDTKVLDEDVIWDPWNRQSQFERLRGVAADIPMNVIVHKETRHNIQTGTWYDYVNKVNVPVYETKWEETVDSVIPLTTMFGKASVTELPTAESSDVTYWYELRFAGGVYGDVCAAAYPPTGNRYGEEDKYTFFQNAGVQTSALHEEVEIGVWKNGEPVKDAKFLYTLIQAATLDRAIATDKAIITMEEKYMPNVWIAGAYFDGRSMYPISQVNLAYDYSDRTLDVIVETDKEAYLPGDEMHVTVSLKDSQGSEVAGTAAIGVVDEAVFALSEQRVALAEQLYQSIYRPNIITNSAGNNSGRAPANTGGGYAADEMSMDAGGMEMGGANAIRQVFRDTAAFQTVEVPVGGAEISVRLPDSVTSWRVTAAAVTGDLQAGDTLSNRLATMPFYLRPLQSDTYLVGDDVCVSLLPVGTALGGQDTVSCSAVLETAEGERVEKEAEVQGGKRAVFNFGKLQAGSYQVTYSGKFAAYSDGVKLPLTVVETGILVPTVETVELSDLSTIKSARWPVSVTIADAQTKPGFDALSWLTNRSGQRTEIIVGSAKALELYNELCPEDQRQRLARDARLAQITAEDGGIKPLPAAMGDGALTAKMLMAAPEMIHPGQAVEFLRGVLKNAAAAPDERIMAYVGLAAAKEPVLLDLQRLYEQEGLEMKPYLRLYVGAAFARMGDYERAREIYGTVKTIREGDLIHVDDSDMRATAAALLLTAESGQEDADGLARYLISGKWDGGKDGALPHLELLAYTRKAIARGGEGKFSYEDNGTTREVALENGAAFLSLDAKTLTGGKFRSLSGKLTAAVRVLVPGDGQSNGSFATVTKTYQPVEESLFPGGQVKVTMRVTFDEDAPYGMYELSDYIPSGLRWLGGESLAAPAGDRSGFYMRQDGQRITGAIYRTAANADGGEDKPVPLARAKDAYVRVLAETTENPEASEAAEEVLPDIEPVDPDIPTPPVDDADQSEKALEQIQEGEEETPGDDGVIEDMELAEEDINWPEDPAPRYAIDEAPKSDARAIEKPASNEFIFTYYLSAALPGSFVTESVWVSHENQIVKSDRGLITVFE